MKLNDLIYHADRVSSERISFEGLYSNTFYNAAILEYASLTGRSPNDAFNDSEWKEDFIHANFNFAEFSSKHWKAFFILTQFTNNNIQHQLNCLGIIQAHLGEQHEYSVLVRRRILLALLGKQTHLVNLHPFDDFDEAEETSSMVKHIMHFNRSSIIPEYPEVV